MPALLLQSHLAELQQILEGLRPAYSEGLPTIKEWIADMTGELEATVLDDQNFLPPSFPSPYGFTVETAKYAAYLKVRNDKVELLSVLVKQGVLPVTAEDKGTLTPQQQQLVKDALTRIDNLTATNPMLSPDAALIKVNSEVSQLHTALLPPRADLVVGGQNDVPAAQTAAREYQTLRLEVQSISKGVWLLYGLLTMLSGLALLILSNPGFGIPVDFIFAFFWGFGLPTTLQSLPTGISVANALNIQIATPTAPRPAGPPPPA
jgi:hypothetical protein